MASSGLYFPLLALPGNVARLPGCAGALQAARPSGATCSCSGPPGQGCACAAPFGLRPPECGPSPACLPFLLFRYPRGPESYSATPLQMASLPLYLSPYPLNLSCLGSWTAWQGWCLFDAGFLTVATPALPVTPPVTPPDTLTPVLLGPWLTGAG